MTDSAYASLPRLTSQRLVLFPENREQRKRRKRISTNVSTYYSRHAEQRLAQRNLTPDAVDYVLIHGHLFYRTGREFYMLRECDVPKPDKRSEWIMRLVGTVVLTAADGTIITMYRNRNGCRDIRRKKRYYRGQGRRLHHA